MTATRSRRRQQRGISLIVSLVLLVVVTLVGLASMRGVSLQARMSATTHDRSLAFQAAEAALREAEARTATAVAGNFPANGCADGYCAAPVSTDKARWLDDAFTGWKTSTAPAPAEAAVPEAIIETTGTAPNWATCGQEIPRLPNCDATRYRVSARSTADERAAVVLQSHFAIP